MTTIKLKRGLEANRSGVTPAAGEPIFTTDTKELFVGDGSTLGGVPVGTVKTSGTPTVGDVVIFKDTTGRLVEPVSKTEFLKEYPKTVDVNAALAQTAENIVKGKVAEATNADNSNSLGSRPSNEYLTVDVITQSYQEDDAAKVTSAAGVKALSDAIENTTVNLDNRVKVNEARLSNLPSKITSGVVAPTGGSHGDLYVQF